MHRAGAVKGLPFTIGGLNMYVYIRLCVLAQKYANAILSLGDIYNNYNNNEGT